VSNSAALADVYLALLMHIIARLYPLLYVVSHKRTIFQSIPLLQHCSFSWYYVSGIVKFQPWCYKMWRC